VLYHQGRAADAEPLAKWVMEVRETHPSTKVDSLFQSVYTLGLIHEAQRHYSESEKLLRRALALQETAIGKDSVQTAVTLHHLAAVAATRGKPPRPKRCTVGSWRFAKRSTPTRTLTLPRPRKTTRSCCGG